MRTLRTKLRKLQLFLLDQIFYKTADSIKERLIDLGLLQKHLDQSIIKRRISRILVKDFYGYWGHDVNEDQYFLGLGLLHYAYVRNLKAKNILCIGSKQGFIPAILALACKDNGFGSVDFVDAGFDESEKVRHWGGVGFWKNIDIDSHFAKIGVERHIRSFVMTTDEFVRKGPKRKYDYIYIDGDHSYDGVKKDHRYFWPRLKKGGIMAIHDISRRGKLSEGVYGVYKFWKEIKRKKSTIEFPNDSGLGIVQKL